MSGTSGARRQCKPSSVASKPITSRESGTNVEWRPISEIATSSSVVLGCEARTTAAAAPSENKAIETRLSIESSPGTNVSEFISLAMTNTVWSPPRTRSAATPSADAPPSDAKPKMGIRRTSRGRFSVDANDTSRLGERSTVVETKISVSTSSGSTSAREPLPVEPRNCRARAPDRSRCDTEHLAAAARGTTPTVEQDVGAR